MTTTEKVIAIDTENCHHHPLNREPSKKHVNELAKSVAEAGQITPGLVRPNPLGKGYQIIAGHCRHLACADNNIQFNAIVRNLDDDLTEKLVVIENLQREDLDPYDEAAKLAILLGNPNTTLGELAGKTGKDQTWLKSRVRLMNLSEKSLKYVKKACYPLSMSEALADYPHDAQAKFIATQSGWGMAQNAKDIHARIRRNSVPLKKANFLEDKRTAVGKCGADGCISTDADRLFKGKKDCQHCLNPDCFNKRLAKWIVIQLNEHLEKYPGNVLMTDNLNRFLENRIPDLSSSGYKTVQSWVPKSDFGRHTKTRNANTRFMFRMDEGKFSIWAYMPKIAKNEKGQDDEMKLTATGKPKPSKVDMLRGKRFIALHERVVTSLEEHHFGPNVAKLIAAFGTYSRFDRGTFRGDRWEMLKNERFKDDDGFDDKAPAVSIIETLQEQVRAQMLERLKHNLNPTQAGLNTELVNEVHNVAAYLKVNVEEWKKEIAEEIVPAKSWKDEVDLYTLEPKKK